MRFLYLLCFMQLISCPPPPSLPKKFLQDMPIAVVPSKKLTVVIKYKLEGHRQIAVNDWWVPTMYVCPLANT